MSWQYCQRRRAQFVLAQVVKPKLLALYFGAVSIGIMAIGYGFNLLA